MLLMALPFGVIIGLTLGAIGSGGSILTVPVLVYVLRENPHGATTASLLIVGITALAGVATHLKAGYVRLRFGLMFGLMGVGGSYLGGRVSSQINPNLLLAAFSILIMVVAATLTQRTKPLTVSKTGEPVATTAFRAVPISFTRLVLVASTVGLLTGFFGVGGGFIVVPALVLGVGLEMPVAVGTSLLVIAVNCASALIARVGSHPRIDVAVVTVFTAAAVSGTLLGARLTATVKSDRLMRVFAALLLILSMYIGIRSVPHLF